MPASSGAAFRCSSTSAPCRCEVRVRWSALTQLALKLSGARCGIVLGYHQSPELGAFEFDDHRRSLSMDDREVLDPRTTPCAHGDNPRHTGSRRADAPKLGPRIFDIAHLSHSGERYANVSVKSLDLLDPGEIQYELVALDRESRHGRDTTSSVVIRTLRANPNLMPIPRPSPCRSRVGADRRWRQRPVPPLLISTAAVLAPFLSARARGLHVPFVVIELGLGIVMGPYVLNLIHPNDLVTGLSEMGLTVLMFLAGYELDLRRFGSSPLSLALVGWIISLGLALGLAFILVRPDWPSIPSSWAWL
jgi:hypothetical protein